VSFTSVIKEVLRQRQEVDVSTDWALLRKLSHKRLESLQHLGLSPATIASYLLAWNCFKTIYVPTQASGTRQLPADPTTKDAIGVLQCPALASCTHRDQSAAPNPGKWLPVQSSSLYLYPTCPPLMHRSQGKNLRNGWITCHNFRGITTNKSDY